MPSQFIQPDKFIRLTSDALANGGARKSLTTTYWSVAGRCESPVSITLESGRCVEKNTGQEHPYRMFLDMDVPCRKCPQCLRAKQYLWQSRAIAEVIKAPRTWFCTFTVAPEHRVRFAVMARRRAGEENFSTISAEIGKAYTKFLKRLRKNSGCRLRYLVVIEEHKNGYPHLHALIHEVDDPISKRQIQAEWPYGFSTVKLVDTGAGSARYVCKYINKSAMARVRASQRYGQ